MFRFERDPDSVPVGAAHRITDIELASRLSFFLWSSIPDEELLTVAEQGKLKDPAVLQQQVKRMLKDPKSQALITNFSGQWLFLRELRNRQPDLLLFPDFDDNLRQSFQTRNGNALRQHRPRRPQRLRHPDCRLHVRERAAGQALRHSEHLWNGFPPRQRSEFGAQGPARTGKLPDGDFGANRTSPVTRGAWILENLLGSPPPLPPPNVPPFPESYEWPGHQEGGHIVRERMEQHRANQPCKGCHQIMDPIGLSLENFDGIGRWRTEDTGAKIDTAGQLVDGTTLDGVESLRTRVAALPRRVRSNDDRKADDVCNRTVGALLRHAGGPHDHARSAAKRLSDFHRWLRQ